MYERPHYWRAKHELNRHARYRIHISGNAGNRTEFSGSGKHTSVNVCARATANASIAADTRWWWRLWWWWVLSIDTCVGHTHCNIARRMNATRTPCDNVFGHFFDRLIRCQSHANALAPVFGVLLPYRNSGNLRCFQSKRFVCISNADMFCCRFFSFADAFDARSEIVGVTWFNVGAASSLRTFKPKRMHTPWILWEAKDRQHRLDWRLFEQRHASIDKKTSHADSALRMEGKLVNSAATHTKWWWLFSICFVWFHDFIAQEKLVLS